MPKGPSLMALPGSNKTFDQFRFDDAECQRYAFQQIGGTTAEKRRMTLPRAARSSARPSVQSPVLPSAGEAGLASAPAPG